MQRNLDLPYPITIADDARSSLRSMLSDGAIERFVVLSDAGTARYAEALTGGMRGRLGLCVVALGERKKRLATLERVCRMLLQCNADRGTVVVGVGGGVAADLFGLAAALFMRGIRYVHVATTLVAMVDAAIGGKTSANLPKSKNTIGAYADPIAVFAHLKSLRTLPYRHLREGLAEVVKHAVIADGRLLDLIEALAPHPFAVWPWETVVADAVKVKTAIVAEDPAEQHVRERLNLGHTFAHGIEAASAYRVTHGAAVAIGLRAAGLLALRAGYFSRNEHLRVLSLLALLRLPWSTAESPSAILTAMKADKKRRRGRLRFVLPRSFGDIACGVEVAEEDVRAVLRRIRQRPGAGEFR